MRLACASNGNCDLGGLGPDCPCTAHRCTVLQFSSLVSGSFVERWSELNRSGVPTCTARRAACARPVAVRAVVAVPGSAPRGGPGRPARAGDVPLRGSTSTTPGGGEPAIANRHRRSGADARRTAPSASRALSAESCRAQPAPAPPPREPRESVSRTDEPVPRRVRASDPRECQCAQPCRVRPPGTARSRAALSEHVPGR
jgi:hypothetical protein